MPEIRDRIEKVMARIAAKLEQLGRAADDCTVIAVTKTHPVEYIDAALRGGLRHFGENKAQEAQRKLPFISEAYQGFHFIGHLQTNKINAVLGLKPTLIHSVDSLYLGEKLNAAAGRINRVQDILIQVNTTAEDSKNGVSFENALELIPAFGDFPNLQVRGLMTIGLMSIDPERTRPYFKMLRELREAVIASGDAALDMSYLSMGMSDDYLVALEEGSNMLRLGSELFGARNYGDK